MPHLTQELRGSADCARLIGSTAVQLSRRSVGWAGFSTEHCGAGRMFPFDPDANCPL